jgi:hypothetical protein
MTRVMLKTGCTCVGELLTFEEFAQLDHRRIWDDLLYAGCCGAPGLVFRHTETGRVALEDSNSVYLEDDDDDAREGGGAPVTPSDAAMETQS